MDEPSNRFLDPGDGGLSAEFVLCPVCDKLFENERDLFGYTIFEWHAHYSNWSLEEWRVWGDTQWAPFKAHCCSRKWTPEDREKAEERASDAGPPIRTNTFENSQIWWGPPQSCG